MIDDNDSEKIYNIFHNKIQSEEIGNVAAQNIVYGYFVLITFLLCAVLFVKFKNQM